MSAIYSVDLSAPPRLPNSTCEVREHYGEGVVEVELRGEYLYVGGTQTEFFFAPSQREAGITGKVLKVFLKGKKPLNVNLRTFLMRHQECVPRRWRGVRPLFFGTMFYSPLAGLKVPGMFWDAGAYSWKEGGYVLESTFGVEEPVLLFGG